MEKPQVRRSTRERHSLTRYSFFEYILLTNEGEPESFQKLKSYRTYELVELSKGKKAY